MSKLYTPRLLALSADLARFPLTGDFQRTSQVRSRTCGGTLSLGVDCDSDGAVSSLGMQVAACAVGQSSAAIMAHDAKGRTLTDFANTLTSIEEWLAGEAPLPEWPGFDALESAHPFPARHGALLMPWKAIVEALSSQDRPR